jgi:hypothetical protein
MAPSHIDPDCGNNNSTLMQFRIGSFNVLSLGDVEFPNISARLRRSRLLQLETDIMILAHHGADNGFTNDKLLRELEPSLLVQDLGFEVRDAGPLNAARLLEPMAMVWINQAPRYGMAPERAWALINKG